MLLDEDETPAEAYTCKMPPRVVTVTDEQSGISYRREWGGSALLLGSCNCLRHMTGLKAVKNLSPTVRRVHQPQNGAKWRRPIIHPRGGPCRKEFNSRAKSRSMQQRRALSRCASAAAGGPRVAPAAPRATGQGGAAAHTYTAAFAPFRPSCTWSCRRPWPCAH